MKAVALSLILILLLGCVFLLILPLTICADALFDAGSRG